MEAESGWILPGEAMRRADDLWLFAGYSLVNDLKLDPNEPQQDIEQILLRRTGYPQTACVGRNRSCGHFVRQSLR